MAEVLIPLLLRDLTDGVREVKVAGDTLAEIVDALDALYPGIAAKIHADGKISPNVALTVDGKIAMQGLATPVRPDAKVGILPAFGGG